jgi:hypothetical protein
MQGLKSDNIAEILAFSDNSAVNLLSTSKSSASYRFDYAIWAGKIYALYKDDANFKAAWPELNKLLQELAGLQALNYAQLYSFLKKGLYGFYDEECFENFYLIVLNITALSGKAEAFKPAFELIAKNAIERAVKNGSEGALGLAEELGVVPDALSEHPEAIKKAIQGLIESSQSNDWGRTCNLGGSALAFAGMSGSPAMVDAVLAFGYNPLKTHYQHRGNLLDDTAVGGNPAAMEKALSLIGHEHLDLITLSRAFKGGHIAAIDFILSKIPEGVEVDFNRLIERGCGLIDFALESGKIEAVRKAINLGCNPEPVLQRCRYGAFVGNLAQVARDRALLQEAVIPWQARKAAKEAAKNATLYWQHKGHADIVPQPEIP